MSKKYVTEYRCDVCGRVHREEVNPLKSNTSPLKEILIPAKKYDCEGRNYTKGMSHVDMCKECYENYWQYVQNRYDVTDCYGIAVDIKGE